MRSLHELYHRHKGAVFGYLWRMTGSPDEADELTQEAFYQAVLSIHRFRGEASVQTWLLKVARNVFLKSLRRRQREEPVRDPEAVLERLAGGEGEPLQRLMLQDERQTLSRGIGPMRDCPLIEDLLPLYVDQAVSPQSRALIEQHLSTCENCRLSLQALQNPGPTRLPAGPGEPPAADEARFLHRLRRQVGTAIGAGLVLLVAVALIAAQAGRWSVQRQAAERIRAEDAYRQEALETLKAVSPEPSLLLKRLGVDLSTAASRRGTELAVDFRVTSPQGLFEHFTPVPGGTRMSVSIHDPATGALLKTGSTGGSSSWQAGQGQGTYTVEPVPDGPLQVRIDYPVFTGYLKVAEPVHIEFRRPGETGEVPLNRRLTLRGVEFEIERVRFDGSQVRVEYRQLTDPAQVGVHFQAIRLSDGLGGGWGGIPMDDLPDPRRPFAEFSRANSPSQNWSVAVQYAVLAIPGPRVTVDLK